MLSLATSCLALGFVTVVMQGIHRFIRAGLAPQRVSAQRTPAAEGLPFRACVLPGPGALQLHAWLVPAQTGAPVAVLLHGWGGNAETLLPLARPLFTAGLNVLLLEARCHGQSDQDTFTSLPRFAEDLEHALIWLRQQPEYQASPIALVGHSVGAAAALLVATRQATLAGVVSIAAFAHPRSMMRRLLASKHIPFWPLGWYVLRYVEKTIGHRFDEIAPITTIRQVRCPVLLVHGTEDCTVPADEAMAIHAQRGGDHVQLKLVSGSHDRYDDLDQEAAELVQFLCTISALKAQANN